MDYELQLSGYLSQARNRCIGGRLHGSIVEQVEGRWMRRYTAPIRKYNPALEDIALTPPEEYQVVYRRCALDSGGVSLAVWVPDYVPEDSVAAWVILHAAGVRFDDEKDSNRHGTNVRSYAAAKQQDVNVTDDNSDSQGPRGDGGGD